MGRYSIAPVEEAIRQGPVVIFRWQNAEGWPVEYASPNAEEVFGYSAEEFMNGEVAYASLIAKSCIDRVAEEVREATESGARSFVHDTYEVIHRSGRSKWLYDATQIVRNEAGAATHYVGYVIDVTDRIDAEKQKRELEATLLHSQKLESLGVLAGGVAHDFNNLLTGILGHAGLALEVLRERDLETVEHLETVVKLTKQAADLTRQLLAYSGRGHFVVSPLDLAQLVHDMSGMLDVVVSKKATLRIECAEGVTAVMADRAQLQQIVMNLISNASDALEGQVGSIQVLITPRDLDPDAIRREFDEWGLEPGPYVSLMVRDDGCGMNAQTRERLFDPFFSTKVAGRGLGMSAVVGIVRGHHGALRIESEPGNGATFEVVFPVTTEDAAPRTEVVRDDGWRGAGTILVVDDRTEVRDIACQMLQHFGFTTIAASDGAQALEIYNAHVGEVVLALVDRTMPVMDGEETLTALLEKSPDLPVVMTSGYDESAEKSGAVSRQAAGFIQKPYRLSELRVVIRGALEP